MRRDRRVTERAQLFAVEFLHRVDELPTRGLAQTGGVRHIEHRIALAAEENALMISGEKPISPVTGLEGLATAAAGEWASPRNQPSG